MINEVWLDRFPLWAVFVRTTAGVLTCIAIGARSARSP